MDKIQKDWIIADYERGHLWCLAICSRDGGKNWYLIEWVNYSNLSKDKLHEKMMDGYKTMIEAKGNTDYSYIQGKYKFNPNDIGSYFKKIVQPHGNFKGITSIKYGDARIDKDEWEKEVSKLLKIKEPHQMNKNEKSFNSKDIAEILSKSMYKAFKKAIDRGHRDVKEIVEDVLDPDEKASVDPKKVPTNQKISVVYKNKSPKHLKKGKKREKGVSKLKYFVENKK